MDWVRIGSSAYWMTFTVAFLAVAAWESRRPERPLTIPAGRRWTMHGLMTILSTVLRVTVVRLSPIAVALAPLHSLSLPLWVSVPLTVLLLDAAKYGTHRLFHAVPWLWRIHRVHHSDPDFDVSTGLRFHPLEPFLPVAAELALILAFALPVEGVVASEVLSVAFNFFEHANTDLPQRWEGVLTGWLFTPRLHRIHHSEQIADQQSNFGEIFSWWDRGLGTYRTKAEGKRVGLRGYQDERSMRLAGMLAQPFQASREPQD